MSYSVFFYCRATGEDVPGSEPLPAGESEIVSHARRVLQDTDDFFGVIAENGSTLQFALVDADEFLAEVPDLDLSGSYTAYLDGEQVFELLRSLPFRFGADTIPGAKFVRW